MAVVKIGKAAWDYTLYNTDHGYVLSVLCGTVGMYELNIPLTAAEVEKYLHGNGVIDDLANLIRSQPHAYADRSVKLPSCG